MRRRGRHVFGIDVGGTNLRVALGSPSGELLDKRHRDTQTEPGATTTGGGGSNWGGGTSSVKVVASL